jgi:hypothetical protein
MGANIVHNVEEVGSIRRRKVQGNSCSIDPYALDDKNHRKEGIHKAYDGVRQEGNLFSFKHIIFFIIKAVIQEHIVGVILNKIKRGNNF